MRGVLFTACLTILALVVLTASFLFHQQGMEEQGSMARLALFDRMADEFTAAEKGLREIINSSGISGINISAEGFTVSITEPLPNPNSVQLEGNASNWKEFVENTSDFSLSVDISDINDKLSMYINGAEYVHWPSFGGNNIRVYGAGDVQGYSVLLQINEDGNIIVDEPVITPPTPHFFNLSITTNTDSYSGDWNLRLDKGHNFGIEINNGQYEISITVGSGPDDHWLKIDNQNQADMIVTTSVTLDQEPTVMFFEQSINITESQYNISRVSSVGIV